MQQGKDFLVKQDNLFARSGQFVSRRQSIYKQYHASYCAVAGLSECSFAEVCVC